MTKTLMIAAVLIVLALALTGGAIVKNKVPLSEPPGLVKRLKIYLSRNTARTGADPGLPELRSRRIDLPRDRVLELIERAVEDAGWRLIDVDPAGYRLHAVVTTPWLGFRDDMQVSLEAGTAGGTIVEITSRSRVGRADFGANLSHIIELHRRLDALVDDNLQMGIHHDAKS